MRNIFCGILLFQLLLPGLAMSTENGKSTTLPDSHNLGTITPAELAATADKWHIFDARPFKAWNKGTIQGSSRLTWENFTGSATQKPAYQLLPFGQLARNLGELGIQEKTPVVIFGDADKSWGSEGWGLWLLIRLGHQGPLRLLDGGSKAWSKEGLPMKIIHQPAPSTNVYTSNLNGQVSVDAAEIRKNATSFTLIDVRTKLEWVRGHIPGAVHIPWRNFASPDGKILSRKKLEAMLKQHGIKIDQPVVYYCAAGVRSGFSWLVHELAYPGVARNLAGGMEEWEATERKK